MEEPFGDSLVEKGQPLNWDKEGISFSITDPNGTEQAQTEQIAAFHDAVSKASGYDAFLVFTLLCGLAFYYVTGEKWGWGWLGPLHVWECIVVLWLVCTISWCTYSAIIEHKMEKVPWVQRMA